MVDDIVGGELKVFDVVPAPPPHALRKREKKSGKTRALAELVTNLQAGAIRLDVINMAYPCA